MREHGHLIVARVQRGGQRGEARLERVETRRSARDGVVRHEQRKQSLRWNVEVRLSGWKSAFFF